MPLLAIPSLYTPATPAVVSVTGPPYGSYTSTDPCACCLSASCPACGCCCDSYAVTITGAAVQCNGHSINGNYSIVFAGQNGCDGGNVGPDVYPDQLQIFWECDGTTDLWTVRITLTCDNGDGTYTDHQTVWQKALTAGTNRCPPTGTWTMVSNQNGGTPVMTVTGCGCEFRIGSKATYSFSVTDSCGVTHNLTIGDVPGGCTRKVYEGADWIGTWDATDHVNCCKYVSVIIPGGDLLTYEACSSPNGGGPEGTYTFKAGMSTLTCGGSPSATITVS